METWDGLKYGPIMIESTEECRVRFGGQTTRLSPAAFKVLLRLLACQGGIVTYSVLRRGLYNDRTVRFWICRIRKFLKRYLGDLVTIKILRNYGYRLSLAASLLLSALSLVLAIGWKNR
jgi:DNA-binding response OmpR family regulator